MTTQENEKTLQDIEKDGYDSFNPLRIIENPYSFEFENDKRNAFLTGYTRAYEEYVKDELLFDCD